MATSDFTMTARVSDDIEIVPKPAATLGLREVWQYRELLYFLIWRDIRVKYKQTVFGVGWALLQPLGLMAIFSVFLGHYAHVPSPRVPYPLMVLAGLLPWQLFSQALSDASNSMVASERLITKVYFPRLIVPAAAAGGALPDFFIAFIALVVMRQYYRVPFTPTILLAPLFILLALVAAFAIGLWLCALNVQYRDVRHAIGFLIQAWMFVTPIVYPISVIPQKWRHFYALNPMVGVVEGFRRAVTGGEMPVLIILASTVATAAILIGGLYYFRRMESTFADVI